MYKHILGSNKRIIYIYIYIYMYMYRCQKGCIFMYNRCIFIVDL